MPVLPSSVVTLPAVGFTLTLPDATTLVACNDTDFGIDAIDVPPNCRSIVVFNMDAARRIFVKFCPTTTITAAMMTISNSVVIGTASSMTFAVGYLGDRPNLAQELESCLYFKAEAGVNVLVNVTYLMGRGTQLL